MGCIDANTAGKWFDGDLSPEARSDVHDHLDRCDDCRALFGELGRVFAGASARPLGGEARGPITIGERIGRYVVVEWLGAGGMGVVYGAYDPELDRRVAIKLLRPEGDGGDADGAEARKRLLREAQALARVSHPNVIAVYDAGTHEGLVFVAMEYLRGGTLAAWLRGQHPTWRTIVARFVDAGRGLAAAHAAQLVHRDFKPSNVLLGADGRVRVTDFGLARSSLEADASAGSGERSWKGTPAYMSPEQREGRAVDARSDQYSFCVALYEALYGELPPTPAREPGRSGSVPRRVRDAVLRGLSASPADRFASMDALTHALSRDRRALLWGAASALAVLLCVALGAAAYVRAEGRPARLCGGASRKLTGIWDGERKNEVATAFRATGARYAGDAFKEVERQLDAYTARWTAMHTEACEATRVHGEQSEELMDLRIACLDAEARELAALTDVFAKADAKTVERAVQATVALPSIGACADGDALRARVRPPLDPTVRAEVLRVRGEINRAKALERAGQYAAADAVAGPLVGLAKATADRSLEADAEYTYGKIRGRLADYAGADPVLYDAVSAAEAASDDVTKARALVELTYLFAEKEAKFDEALRTGQLASAVLTRLPHEVDLQANLEDDLAFVDADKGRFVEGAARGERALAMRERAFGPDDYRIALSLNNTSKNLFLMGEFVKALAYEQRAVDIYKRALGPHHPSVAMAVVNAGLTELQLRRLDDALRDASEGLAIWQDTLGPDHPNLIQAEGVIATILDDAHRSSEALPHGERALALAEKAFPKDHPYTVNALNTLGKIDQSLGRIAEAIVLHTRAMAMAERLGNPPDEAAETWNDLGDAYLRAGRSKDAIPLLERALSVRASQATDPTELAETRLLLARALWEGGGDRDRAKQLAGQARDGFAAHEGYEPERDEAAAWLASRR